jgi:hypothetical protein
LPVSQFVRPGRRFVSRALPSSAVPQTAAELANQITSIRQIIVSGTEEAAYGDKRVGYRSLEELKEILNGLEEELADLLGLGGRIRQIRMTNQWDKGL